MNTPTTTVRASIKVALIPSVAFDPLVEEFTLALAHKGTRFPARS
jgi:hypothetical protein